MADTKTSAETNNITAWTTDTWFAAIEAQSTTPVDGYITAEQFDVRFSPLAGSASITTLGTISTGTWSATDVAVAAGGTGASTAGGARTNLGLVIGTNVQAFGAILDDLNTLGANAADSEFLVGTAAGALAWETGATARTSIGLGNVEDTALSTWAGSANITTLGTITEAIIIDSVIEIRTEADNNLFIGENINTTLTTGDDNTSVGWQALDAITEGGNNVALGSQALGALTTGSWNMAIGTNALLLNVTGNFNVAIGANVLNPNTASNNTGIGYQTAAANTSGSAITAIGMQALSKNTTANDSTGVGRSALLNSTGAQNTGIGRSAGSVITTGTLNTLVGYDANVTVNSLTNATAIGANADVSTSNTVIFGNSSIVAGGIGGITTAAAMWHVNTTDAVTNAITDVTITAHQSSGTPAAAFGAGSLYLLESSTTADQDAGRLSFEWVTATHASRASRGDLSSYYTSSENTAVSWGSDSSGGLLSFFDAALVAQQTEITDELTTVTHTAPGTPDYALQDLIDSGVGSAFGFATKDEGNTLLSVVVNNQARIKELEDVLNAYGLLADAD